jgi:hypothetical protein
MSAQEFGGDRGACQFLSPLVREMDWGQSFTGEAA